MSGKTSALRRAFKLARLVLAWVLVALSVSPAIAGPTAAGRTLVVPIDREIDLGLAPFVERVLASATAADTVVLHMNTFGGRVDAAVRIRDAILASPAHTVAFVDKRAISAGALISLATNEIVMARGATIGAATPVHIEGGKMQPVEQKIISYMRKEMKATAEARGRRGDIAEAMVDASVTVEGWREHDATLTLTTTDALEIGLITRTAESLDELCANGACVAAPSAASEPNWAERAAGFLTNSAVSSLLMALGMLGIMIELNAPGHALAGTVGVVALILFFFGHYVVHLAGWGEILLFVAGAAAIVVEVFFWPGHGALAVAGILAILASLALAIVGGASLPFDVMLSLGLITRAAARVFGSMMATFVVMLLVSRWLPSSRLGRRFILEATITAQAGPSALLANRLDPLVGALGVAATDLKPGGKATVDGRRVDVVTDGEYVEAGSAILVSAVEGTRIVVQRTKAA